MAEEALTEGTLGTYAPSESGASRPLLLKNAAVDVTLGQTLEMFSDRARQVVVEASETARALGHGILGAEHLLLGVTAACSARCCVSRPSAAGGWPR